MVYVIFFCTFLLKNVEDTDLATLAHLEIGNGRDASAKKIT